ncbi:MAG: transketolase C-terminal domain-containing protein, partial [Ignavibacteria bacterium]|nr:transketolase C-terminal domain-containing protein [Ignavibacteria bacterium]
LLAVGSLVQFAINASEKLSQDGISAEVINMRFVKPLDEKMLDEIAAHHKKIITLEENTIVGGFGSGVTEYFAQKNYKNDILVIGLPDAFVEHGTQPELYKMLEIDADGIVKRTKLFLNNKYRGTT